MDVQFWAATDTGRARDHNEDNFLVDKRLSLFVVCDGMGGHAAGEVASAIAVRAIREVVANNRDILERCKEHYHDTGLRRELLKLMEYAVQEACTRIFDMAQQQPEKRGMGTTCSMLTLRGRRGFIAHVGDSRIYLHRKGQVHQLTEDHTLANEMLRRGKVRDPSQVSNKYKNAITRAVGVYESVEVDTLDFDCLPGDRFLLCSDGLSGYLEDHDLMSRYLCPKGDEHPATQEELKEICTRMIAFANSKGGKDNITAVCVGLSEGASDDIETEEIKLTMETIRSIPLFHYLSYKELVQIVNVTGKRVVPEGQWLIQEGDDGDELFVIMRGEYAVERGDQEIARLGPGRHFGEMALIDDGPRSASVRCVSPGTLLTVRRSDFYDLLRKDPTLAVKLLWNFIQTLSTRLREAPYPPAKVARRFENAVTGGMLVPPAGVTSDLDLEELTDTGEREAVARPGAPTLDQVPDSALLDQLEKLSDITGEEITLPGLKVPRGEQKTQPSQPRRRHGRGDSDRRSSVVKSLDEKP